METKICKKCGIEKELEDFGKTNRNVDGYNGGCKSCHNKTSNGRYHGIKNGTYNKRIITEVDRTYFENIDNEEKSYWLGFLYADGCVRKRINNGMLRLKLKQTDREHIEKFKLSIKSEHKIIDGIDFFQKNDRQYESHYSSFSIYSLKLVNDLINLGCVVNKAQKIRLPKFDNELLYHFIRGYFDGDGCIHKVKNRPNSFKLSVVSNQFFCEDLLGILNMGTIRNFENYSILEINKIDDVKNFRNLIYYNSTIFLERKKDIFNTIVDDFKRDYTITKNKKTYLVTTPEGVNKTVYHLSKFCCENNLIYSTMSNLSRGIGKTCKNWKCEILTN